jgi:hypothetical protein
MLTSVRRITSTDCVLSIGISAGMAREAPPELRFATVPVQVLVPSVMLATMLVT